MCFPSGICPSAEDDFGGFGSDIYSELCGELGIKDDHDDEVVREMTRYDAEIAHANALLTPPPEPPKCLDAVLNLLAGNLGDTVCDPIKQSRKVLKAKREADAKLKKSMKSTTGKRNKGLKLGTRRRASFGKVHC